MLYFQLAILIGLAEFIHVIVIGFDSTNEFRFNQFKSVIVKALGLISTGSITVVEVNVSLIVSIVIVVFVAVS